MTIYFAAYMLDGMELLKSERRVLQGKITELIQGRLREFREGLGGLPKHTGQEVSRIYGLSQNRQSELLKPKKYGTVVSWRDIHRLVERRFILFEEIKERADLTDKEVEYLDSTLGMVAKPAFMDALFQARKHGVGMDEIIQSIKSTYKKNGNI